MLFFIGEMFITRIKYGLKHTWKILSEEGMIPAFSSLKNDLNSFLRGYIFYYDDYYLYEHTLMERNELDYLPKVKDFTFHMISSNQQADALAANSEDFRDFIYIARRALDIGAIAFCVFIKGKFAHIGWVALTEEARNIIDDLIPLKVDFSNKEAYTGGTFTVPRFRGKGLMTYGYFKRFQYLYENGIRIVRNVVSTDNIASQKVHGKFHPKIYGKVTCVRLFRRNILLTPKHELHN